MKKEYKITIIFLLLVLIGIIVYEVLLDAGIIRDYHIKDFVIDITIEDDGDIRVKEDTVYRFNGRYNGITITIPTNVSKELYNKLTKDSMNDSKELPDSIYIANGIEDVSIYVVENGTNRYFEQVKNAGLGSRGVYTMKEEEGFTTYTIHEPSNSVDKKIVIEYTLKDVIVQHNDCQELFWNFIGGEVECDIKNLDINIYGSNVSKVYTHGNFTGIIKNTVNKTKINYTNVKSNEFVSARVLLNNFNNDVKKTTNVVALPIVEEIEESYLNKKQTAINLNAVAILMTIIILAYWCVLLVKYEKEIEPVPLVMYDVEILNKYNPMVAACIAQNRGLHPRDILAVLIDLVNIGVLKMVHIRGYVIGSQNDMYKLTKNESFIKDEEKMSKLDDMQILVMNTFFKNDKEIELSKRLKEMSDDVITINYLKGLDNLVSSKLEEVGANYSKVPKIIRVFNTFMFIVICIYIIFTIGYNIVLSYVTLSVNGEDMIYALLSSVQFILIGLTIFIPLAVILLKCILILLNLLRKSIVKLAFKLTSKKLTRTIITLTIIFALVFMFEIMIFDAYIIIETMLFFSALLVILTDNLMTSHSNNINKEYVMLKLLQYKIEAGSLLEQKNIQDTILWNRYFTFAIALGVGNVAQYVRV